MVAGATADELSVLVLTIQDAYAELSRDKAIADNALATINNQYKEAMDEISSLNSNIQQLEQENDEVRSMMETQSVQFEHSVSEMASIEKMKADSETKLAQLTAQLSKYKQELAEVSDEKNSLEEEMRHMSEELKLARRDAERARLEATMSNEDSSKQFRERQSKLEAELDNLRRKFDMERNVVDQQKSQIDDLEYKLETQKEDTEAAAGSYEAAISELQNMIKKLRSESSNGMEELKAERDELREINEEFLEERKTIVDRANRAERDAQQYSKELNDIKKDIDAIQEEYEEKISGLESNMEELRSKYERQLDGMTKEGGEHRDRVADLERQLEEAKKNIEELEAEEADLQDEVEMMKQNMAAVREDFSTRLNTAKDEAAATKEGYEEELEKLRNVLDVKNKEAREAMYQCDLNKDKVTKLEDELKVKDGLLQENNNERKTTTDMYEDRLQRMRNEMKASNEVHTKEMGGLLEENEEMKKAIEDMESHKRTADYRIRRLEEDLEAEKELRLEAKKEIDESKEDYENVMQRLMTKMKETEEEADTKVDEMINERDEARVECRKLSMEKRQLEDRIELITADKEVADAKVAKLQEEVESTIRSYESKLDGITLKYLDKIDVLKNEKADSDDRCQTLLGEQDHLKAELKSCQNELSGNKFAYERRIENLQMELETATTDLDGKIEALESELHDIINDRDVILKEKMILSAKVRDLEADNEEANDTLGKLTEQMTLEREEHEDKIDEITKKYKGIMDRMAAEKADLSDVLNQMESDLANREAAIDQLEQERRNMENKIEHLKRQNEELNRTFVDLSNAKREAMEKIRGLEEDVSDADGAIDDAKAAIETLLEEKKAADVRIQNLMNERANVDSVMDQLRKQNVASKKELESKLFDALRENEELNHNII